MDASPASVIVKKPISPVLPKRFFVATRHRSSSAPSPSSTSTASTRCSKARRPAISSLLFICPIISTALGRLLFFACATRADAHSMVCVGLPAREGKNSAREKVWMLSRIIRSGSISRIASNTLSIEVSATIQIFSAMVSRIRSARFLI